MDCQQTSAWIWETPRPNEAPPDAARAHLAECDRCRDERAARVAVGRDLRGLRDELEDEPPAGLDARVLRTANRALEAHETGRYPIRADSLSEEPIPDDIADELADSIAEDFGAQFAAMTTGRLRTRRIVDEADAAAAVAPPPAPPETWQPPRATPQWMLAACLLLAGTLLIGFVAGRISTQALGPTVDRGSAPTITAANDAVLLTGRQRLHRVGLSEGGVDALQEGNTYLLAGPVGGPYEVIGIVSWGHQSDVALPAGEGGEVVVAVGPAGGWSRGKELAMNELREVEILGRRALPQRR